ncbi:MAG: hypothetical protein P8H62_01545, partial [Henriciella sp.]|nr:hypothetical protein [Henriciella sp.]
HVNMVEKSVIQNPREVNTKFGKTIDTFFVKGFEEAEQALAEWMSQLDDVMLYGPDDPLFPATTVRSQSSKGFEDSGFERRNWKST